MNPDQAGVAPGRDDFSLRALFPIGWMFFGYIFAINLFVGVVVDNFSRMQREEKGSAVMTVEQQQWAEMMRSYAKLLPSKAARPPRAGCRRGLHRLVTSAGFDAVITAAIVLNIGVMACDYWRIEHDPRLYAAYSRTMTAFNYVRHAEPRTHPARLLIPALSCKTVMLSHTNRPYTPSRPHPTSQFAAVKIQALVRARAAHMRVQALKVRVILLLAA